MKLFATDVNSAFEWKVSTFGGADLKSAANEIIISWSSVTLPRSNRKRFKQIKNILTHLQSRKIRQTPERINLWAFLQVHLRFKAFVVADSMFSAFGVWQALPFSSIILQLCSTRYKQIINTANTLEQIVLETGKGGWIYAHFKRPPHSQSARRELQDKNVTFEKDPVGLYARPPNTEHVERDKCG